MTQSQAGSTRVATTPIATVARLLITEGTPDAPADDVVVDPASVDVEEALIACAVVVLGELGVMHRLTRTNGAHPQVIAGIVNLAESYGTASPTSIGAMGSLVDLMRSRDEAELARLLAAARDVVTDTDLFHGAAALLAAATSYLADMLGELPVDVHDEIHGAPEPPIPT